MGRVITMEEEDTGTGDGFYENTEVDLREEPPELSMAEHYEKNYEKTEIKPADMVNHPPHYTEHPSGVECIQITEHMNFNLGNALKYVWRSSLKDSQTQDLEKAIWYIQREINRIKPTNEPVKCIDHSRMSVEEIVGTAGAINELTREGVHQAAKSLEGINI